MRKPEFEDYGITEDEFQALYAQKKNIRNYTFGISSALGIITGCIVGLYLSQGLYETVVFILFFGGFLGCLFGAGTTILTVTLYMFLLYIFSPTYRRCRQYRAARSKSASKAEEQIP